MSKRTVDKYLFVVDLPKDLTNKIVMEMTRCIWPDLAKPGYTLEQAWIISMVKFCKDYRSISNNELFDRWDEILKKELHDLGPVERKLYQIED